MPMKRLISKAACLFQCAVLFVTLLFSTQLVAVDQTISNVPLELAPSVPPNVFILTDDSGSMNWEVLTQNYDNAGAYCSDAVDGACNVGAITHRVPEAGGPLTVPASCQPYIDPATAVSTGDYVDGYVYIAAFNSNTSTPQDLAEPANNPYIRNCFVAADNDFRARNAIFNPLYFDPTKTYEPWAGVDINGNAYGDIDIENALDNPYDPANSETINLMTQAPGLDAAGSRITDGTGFRYYLWNDDGDDLFEAGEEVEFFIKNETDDAVKQNFANWFSYYRKREYVAKALASHAVVNSSGARVGFSSTNQNASVGERVLLQEVSTTATNKRIILDGLYSISSSGNTTLRQSFEKTGKYFDCESGDIFGSTAASIPGSSNCPSLAAPAGTCHANSAFILTDGFDNGPSPTVGNEDDGSSPGDFDSDFDDGAFKDGVPNTLADIAMYYYENDFHNSLDDDVPPSSIDFLREPNTPPVLEAGDTLHQHLNTNVVGILNNYASVVDTSFPTDAKAAFSWNNAENFLGMSDGLRHTAYNGRGSFISVNGASNLASALTKINSTFSRVAANSGSTTAVAFNTQSIREDTLVFRTFSNLATNSGDLVAQRVNADGSFNVNSNGDPVIEWSAAAQLEPRDASSNQRNIFTFDSLSDAGNNFELSDLTADQISALENPVAPTPPATILSTLVESRVDYLLGDTANQGTDFEAGELRERSFTTITGVDTAGKLGDIVHSSPVFVGAPPFVNRIGGAFPSTQTNTYAEFRVAQQSREQLVYVGANDGMLHAFQVSDGEEAFAYLPNILLDDIGQFTDPNYTHRFYVDSTPSVNDVFISPVGGGTAEWRTVLVNGLGAGGKGYFALDITEPGSFDASDVMWEFSEEDDGGVDNSDLGLSYSRPVIGMSNAPSSGNKDWIAIFGNGFNSTASGNAVIYILLLDNGYNGWSEGTDFIKLDTGVGPLADGTPNGIGGVTAIDTDGNGTVDRAYAGDRHGNVYVIDLSGTSSSAWNIEKTLFTASYEFGSPTTSEAQPITTKPTVVANPSGGYVVIVGTGSYFTVDDATSDNIQSIYGLWDNPSNANTIQKYSSPSELVEQEFTTTVSNGVVVRTVSANPVVYNDNQSDAIADVRGWFIDFDIPPPNTSSGVQFAGERPVRNLQLRNSQLFFSTVIPQDSTDCLPPAGGFGLSIDALSGSVGTNIVFDINIDGVFNAEDNINGLTASANIVAGTRFESAPGDTAFIGGNRITQLTDGSVDRILINPELNDGALLGRHSWKEIIR